MLKANKSRWFEKIFAIYNRNLLKRRFHSFQVSGVDVLQEAKPQIIYVNHSSWWDGLAAFEIFKLFDSDSFVMMEEKQLKNLPLFRLLGAFSVVRENPRQAVESINYAAELLLEDSRRTVWIFPQGEILPNDVRPLHFYRGLGRVVEKVGGCTVIPCAMRYEFLGDFKPEIFIKIGHPMHFSRSDNFKAKNSAAVFEDNLSATLDNLKRDIREKQTSSYTRVF